MKRVLNNDCPVDKWDCPAALLADCPTLLPIMAISRQKEARSWDYALLLFRMTSRVLYSTQYHRQHCTLHALEQFGALYMHNHDDKYPSRPGFEPGTPRLQDPVNTNEPLGPTTLIFSINQTCKLLCTRSQIRHDGLSHMAYSMRADRHVRLLRGLLCECAGRSKYAAKIAWVRPDWKT